MTDLRAAGRWKRIVAALVAILLATLVVVADGVFLVDVLRLTQGPIVPSVTVQDVTGKAVFFAVACWVAAIPGLLLLGLAARRAKVAVSSLVVVAGTTAILVGINGGRIQMLASRHSRRRTASTGTACCSRRSPRRS